MAFEFTEQPEAAPRSTSRLMPNMDDVARLGSTPVAAPHQHTEQIISGDVFPNPSIGKDRPAERFAAGGGSESKHPFHRVLAHIENSVHNMHSALKGMGGSGKPGEGGQQHPCPFVAVANKVGFTPKGAGKSEAAGGK